MRYPVIAATLLIVSPSAAGLASDVPDFRPGTVELSLGLSQVLAKAQAEEINKVAFVAAVALALKTSRLTVFANLTQLPTGGKGDVTLQGQIFTFGIQHQIAIRLPWRSTPFIETGLCLSNTQLVSQPINYIYDNDAGAHGGWPVGGGIRIPFGREARAGVKVGYRHIWIPNSPTRKHLDQFTAEFTVFIRPS